MMNAFGCAASVGLERWRWLAGPYWFQDDKHGVRFTSTTDPLRDACNIGNALGYPAQGRSWAVQASYRF